MSQAGSLGGGGSGPFSISLTGNSGGAVHPTLGNINVIGSGLISIVGNPGTSTMTVSYAGTGGTHTFHTDSGDAVESGNAITVAGGTNINTVGSGATVTVNLDNNVTISGTYTSTGGNLVLPITSNDGSSQGCIFSGADRVISFPDSQNIYIGFGAGTYPNVVSVSSNIAIGDESMAQIAGPATGNVALGIQSLHGVINGSNNNMAIGSGALSQLRTGDNNVAVGAAGLGDLTVADNNTAIGAAALSSITTGTANIGIGGNAGVALTTSDSHNICIANVGVVGNNGVIRIGNGTNHSSAFMAGIYGVTPANSPEMMTVGSDGELGSQAIPASSISITGDTGGALFGNAFTFTGGTTGLSFGGAGSTETVTVTNFNLPATNTALTSGVITVGGNRFMHARGTDNVFLGSNAGNATFTVGGSQGNVFIGTLSGSAISTTCRFNSATGYNALGNITTSEYNVAIGSNACSSQLTQSFNTAVGASSMVSITTGSGNNTAVGYEALGVITTGSFNTVLGYQAGWSLTGSNSSNILIGNLGTAGDNHTIRIGTQGSLDAQQNRAFIAGVYGITPATSPQLMTIGSDGELGSQAIPSQFAWNEITGTSSGMAVNNGYIANNGSLVTLTLPATAALGSILEVSGKGAGGWSIAQNSGQTIHFGASNTTTGVGGSLSSTLQYDTVRMVCITANTDFVVLSSVGNLTVV